jgi:hypothetical protein
MTNYPLYSKIGLEDFAIFTPHTHFTDYGSRSVCSTYYFELQVGSDAETIEIGYMPCWVLQQVLQ